MRGTGDAYALRKAYHDEKVNSQLPARLARRRRGVRSRRTGAGGSHRRAGHERRRRQPGRRAGTAAAEPAAWARRGSKDEAPLADVLGLMVREALTGEKPPASVAGAVDLWRPFIEEQGRRATWPSWPARCATRRLSPSLTRTMLNHLALGDQTDSDQSSDRRCRRRKPRRPERRRRRPGRPAGRRKRRHRIRRRSRRRRRGRKPMPASEQSEDLSDATEPEDGAKPNATKRPSPIRTTGATRSSPPNSTRKSPPPICARPRNWRGCAASWTSSCPPCRAWCRAWPTSCSAC